MGKNWPFKMVKNRLKVEHPKNATLQRNGLYHSATINYQLTN